MTRRFTAGIAVLLGVLLCGGSPLEARDKLPRNAKPLPVNKTTTVRGQGSTWVIDGPTVIPPHVELRVELGTVLLGINNASLDVQGGLKIHGTEDYWVVVKDVDFSPTRLPKRGLHLDMVDFRGCKFDHGADAGFDGECTIENACFQRDCKFNFRPRSGFLKIMTVEVGCECHIHAVPHENQRPIEIEIRSSWMNYILLQGPCHANVRHCELKGGIECKNVDQVMIDGCDVRDDIIIRQAANETFKKITLTKCNMFSGTKMVFERPTGPKTKKERIRLDKFYFGPDETGGDLLTGKKIASVIQDGADLPKGVGNVFVKHGQGKKRKHHLVSYTLRSRAPPLR